MKNPSADEAMRRATLRTAFFARACRGEALSRPNAAREEKARQRLAATFASCGSFRARGAMSRGVFALILAALFSFFAPRVLAAAQSESKEAAAWREVEENRARREIGAIYNAMAAAQKRGDTKAALKFFARDVQVVTDSGARLGFKDLQRVLALPAATMRLNVVKTSIAGFARRGIYADAKVMARIEASTRGAKPQHRVIETLRRERWRKTSVGWRLIFSKTLAQTMRAK